MVAVKCIYSISMDKCFFFIDLNGSVGQSQRRHSGSEALGFQDPRFYQVCVTKMFLLSIWGNVSRLKYA